MTNRVGVLTLVLVLGACTNTELLDEDAVGADIQPIYQGILGGAPSVVGLQFHGEACTPEYCEPSYCTGAIVSPHLVLTATHCLTKADWTSSGDSELQGKVAIDYDDPKTGNAMCLTRSVGNVNARCVPNVDTDFATLTGFVNPYSTGATDRFHDQSLLGGPELSWPQGIDETDFASYAVWSQRDSETSPGAAVRPGDTFFAVGFGLNGDAELGKLRVANGLFKVDSIDKGVLRNVAGTVRMCHGDSGSPALWTFGNVPVVAGVHSGDDSQSDCADVGSNQYWALTESQSGFISDVMNRVGTPCYIQTFTPSSNVTLNTFQCW